MENIIWIGIGVLGGTFLAYFLFGKKKENETDNNSLQLILQQMNEFTNSIRQEFGQTRQELGQTSQNINESIRAQLSDSQKLLREVNEQMSKNLIEIAREQTKTNEATKQFLTIAEQLSNLEKVLKHQKQRGNLGEASLELILSNILPPENYEMQHEFNNKEKVDAVIFTKEGMIPVDAKFSLENYERLVNAIDEKQKEELEKAFKNDLKKRIDETSKYIKVEEGTLSFAFMFIPAEAIYYDLLINETGGVKVNSRNLIDYAHNEKKVIIVSPTTFYAYLQSVLYGFKAFKFEEKTKETMKWVEKLGNHLKAYEKYHNAVGKAIGTAYSQHNLSSEEFRKLDKDVLRISGTSPELSTLSIEKPRSNEE